MNPLSQLLLAAFFAVGAPALRAGSTDDLLMADFEAQDYGTWSQQTFNQTPLCSVQGVFTSNRRLRVAL